ncbi:MAG: hypothetical protein A2Z19_03955 [Deltaproteobacteria bacterium RBG_16_54_18]|nr:MAG: hypothetical protein A2Z19_03955 [Deltaproteobacteria bacterium RBG_16_54_18]
MFRRSCCLSALLLLFIVTGGCIMQKAALREGRGMWVVRFQLNSPPALDQVVDDARQEKFNLLFVQVNGRSDAYYRSPFVPRAESLAEQPDSFDPLDYVLQRGHDAGLQIHAWLNALYAWPYPPPYPLSPQHVVNSHPEWLIWDDEGRTLSQYTQNERVRESSEGLYLDPANPLVRDYILRVCREIVQEYDVDGIHLDFIRYPGSRWGYNQIPVETFIQRWGVDPRLLSVWVRNPTPEKFIEGKLPLHLRWQYYYYSLWAEQKSGYITALVKDIRREVKSIRRGVIISAAVFPDPQVAYYLKGQDWHTWMEQGYLDLLVPMTYHGDPHRVMAEMAEAKKRAQGRLVYAGLGAWIKAPYEIAEEVEGLKGIGMDGFTYFSYQGMKECDEEYLKQVSCLLHRDRVTPPRLREGDPAPLQTTTDGAELLLRSLKRQFFSLEDYQNLLNRLGMTEDTLRERLRQEAATFERITQELYARAVPSSEQTVLLPRSVEVQVISRAAHPQDAPQTRQEVYLTLQEAYARLRKGDDFVRVAKQYAQWGGATTDKVFLQDGWNHTAIISALKEGNFTPVLEVPSGYAIYKIIKFHPAEQRVYGKLPVWLKRVAFQERLARLIGHRK